MVHNSLVAQSKSLIGDSSCFRIWSLPDLELQYELQTDPDVVAFARIVSEETKNLDCRA